jgi:RNA polymerase sigma-70 factor (ECF subfamily)
MDTKISENSKFTLDDIAQEYGKLVSSVCRRMITDEDIARDAAQQVWVEMIKNIL